MNEELYNELREIEDRLFLIVGDKDAIIDVELLSIWTALYLYLDKVKPIK